VVAIALDVGPGTAKGDCVHVRRRIKVSCVLVQDEVNVELPLARDKRQAMARDPRCDVIRELGRRVKCTIGLTLALPSAVGYGISDSIGGIASRQVAARRRYAGCWG